jgi:hypothetical protein
MTNAPGVAAVIRLPALGPRMPVRPSRLLPALTALLLVASPPTATAGPGLPTSLPTRELDWGWSPLELGSDIRVAPLVVVGPLPSLEPVGFLGEELQGDAATLRALRCDQVAAVTESFSDALPGALASALPPGWQGHFSDARVPASTRTQLTAGLDGRRSLDSALQLAVDRLPGEVVLFRWISDIEAQPLGTTAAPGTTLRAADRLVYVDEHTDPVLAHATVGLALVAADGEVFLRYEDRYSFVITGTNTSLRAGRDLARRLVEDLQPLLAEPSVATAFGP